MYDCALTIRTVCDTMRAMPTPKSNPGSAIRAARLRVNLSQSELARRLGVTREQIARLETGITKDPRSSTMRALARELGTSVDLLLADTKA